MYQNIDKWHSVFKSICIAPVTCLVVIKHPDVLTAHEMVDEILILFLIRLRLCFLM